MSAKKQVKTQQKSKQAPKSKSPTVANALGAQHQHRQVVPHRRGPRPRARQDRQVARPRSTMTNAAQAAALAYHGGKWAYNNGAQISSGYDKIVKAYHNYFKDANKHAKSIKDVHEGKTSPTAPHVLNDGRRTGWGQTTRKAQATVQAVKADPTLGVEARSTHNAVATSVGAAVGSTFHQTSGPMTTRVRRTEVVNLTLSSTVGTKPVIASIDVNPGNPIMFPWGSKVFHNYELFTIRHLEFQFHPTGSTSQTGGVVMSYEPDFMDAVPNTTAALLQQDNSVGGSYWQNLSMVIPPHLFNPQHNTAKFVSNTGRTKDYQHVAGRLMVATHGASTVLECGFLTVTYDIDISVPQTHDWVNAGFLDANTKAGVGASITSVAWLEPTLYEFTQSSNLDNAGWFLRVDPGNLNRIYFPQDATLAGNYMVVANVRLEAGASLAATGTGPTYGTGCSSYHGAWNGSSYIHWFEAPAATALEWWTYTTFFTYDGVGNIAVPKSEAGHITLPHLGAHVGNISVDLVVTRIPEVVFTLDNVRGEMPLTKQPPRTRGFASAVTGNTTQQLLSMEATKGEQLEHILNATKTLDARLTDNELAELDRQKSEFTTLAKEIRLSKKAKLVAPSPPSSPEWDTESFSRYGR